MNTASNRTSTHGLQVATVLKTFVDQQVLPGTGVAAPKPSGPASTPSCATWRRRTPPCWPSATACRPSSTPGTQATPGPISDMASLPRLPARRSATWCRVPAKVKATTKNVDAELALQAGPQLVVPITNARYALNAANARWGSLYDALYGTDAHPEDRRLPRRARGYNPVRGAKVIDYARHVLDRMRAAGKKGSHVDSTGYRVVDGAAGR